MTKKVPPYLRHTKPPYTIHAYSPVLAARTDMVPWYKAPVVVRHDPIIQVPDIETAPVTSLTEDDFARMVAEQNRVEALKAAAKGNGAIEAAKGGTMKAVEYDVSTPYVFEDKPDSALTEDDFDRIKEPEVDTGPVTPMDHDDVSMDAPVEGTPAGNAAKMHGQPTRKKGGIDTFAGVTPPDAKKPAGMKSPFGDSPFAKSRTY